MSSINPRDAITDYIIPFVKKHLGQDVPVIITRQNNLRPNKDYVVLDIVSPLSMTGFSDSIQHSSDSTFNVGGQRVFTLGIQYIVVDPNRNVRDDFFKAQEKMEIMRDAMLDIVKLEDLHRQGLSVWSLGAILDLTEVIETGFEPRAQMDVIMGISSNRDAELGVIESVEYVANIQDEDGDEDSDDLVTIE